MCSPSYRPLAGMNCFERIKNFSLVLLRYRPLAGMNCFMLYYHNEITGDWLPSPRGDELFPFSNGVSVNILRMLPSPRGDELFLTRFLFPWMMQTSYRPLAGMNCFRAANVRL